METEKETEKETEQRGEQGRHRMIACIDVGYSETNARAACVVVTDWQASTPTAEYIAKIFEVEDYQPGQFYRRELPCIEAVLAKLPETPDCIVIDGYVWLGDQGQKGLGAYLHEAFDGEIPVIGVAKNSFKGADFAFELIRGQSDRPLYITATGIELSLAADFVRLMHGPYRVPTILKRVDQLSRGEKAANPELGKRS